MLFVSEWEWEAAGRSLSRALAAAPGHVEALLQYGRLHDALGDNEAGLRLKKQAFRRAPLSPLVLMEVAVSHLLQRRFHEALKWTQKALAADPRNQRAAQFVTVTCLLNGDVSGIVTELRRRSEISESKDSTCVALERELGASAAST